MKVYKVLGEDGSAFHGGYGKWPLPSVNDPGKWLEHKGALIPCRSGLHLCRRSDLVRWLGPTIYEAEYEGDFVDGGSKIVVSKARLLRKFDTWNKTTARLFACDCADHSIHIIRRRGLTPDGRSLEAIKVARKFARGEATEGERDAARTAAWDAARDAAGDAAGAAARAAARTADWVAARAAASTALVDAAGVAAWAVAGAADWDAAGAAARSAAESAERSWQTKRLFEYLDGKRS